jgi:RNAse (barnase) inhibitor barstar
MKSRTASAARIFAMSATLTKRRSPWVVFTGRDDPWLNTETDKLREQGGRVFRLDGRKLREPEALFATFAEELSFPDYFGRNWDALVDCLHHWHGHEPRTKDVAVLIDNADDLLSADFLGLLVSVLCQAAWKANLQLDADGIPNRHETPFTLHFVFLLDGTTPSAFAKAAASGMDVSVAVDTERLTATLTVEDWPEVGPETSPREL